MRDYIHVDDLASAHVAVVEAEGLPPSARFNVGTGHGFSVLEVVEAVGRRLGRKPEVEWLPRRAGDPAALVADPSAIKAAVGWEPVHSSIEEVVESAAAWEEKRGQA